MARVHQEGHGMHLWNLEEKIPDLEHEDGVEVEGVHNEHHEGLLHLT
jgi:hypothetical protein